MFSVSEDTLGVAYNVDALRACLNFLASFFIVSHRIFGYIHEVLNIEKTNYTDRV